MGDIIKLMVLLVIFSCISAVFMSGAFMEKLFYHNLLDNFADWKSGKIHWDSAVIYITGDLLMVFLIPLVFLGVARMLKPSLFKGLFDLYLKVWAFPFRAVYLGFRSLFRLATGKKLRQPKPGNPIKIKLNVPEKAKPIALQTDRGEVQIPNPYRGILVVGGAGSGKTESFAIPLIREFSRRQFTGLVYDFKFPVLAKEISDYYGADNPVKRYFLNFADARRSHRVNPLNPAYMPFSAYAREYAQAITKNLMRESIRKEDFWSRSATDLLTAVIWYLRRHYPQYCDLPHTLALLQCDYRELVKLLVSDVEVRSMISSIATAVESGASEQIAGVVGSLQGAVAQINTPEFMYIFGGDDFSLELNNPEHPSVMTVGSDPTITNTIAPLCSLVISVAAKMMNQPQRQPSFVMLDESPTVFIPNIEVIPNTGRSNKIATVLFVQDIAQLTDGYGKEKADVLFASCGTHFYGRVSASQTAELLSRQFGKEDQEYESTSVSRNANPLKFQANVTKSGSIQEREVIKPAQFMNLETGHFVGRVADNPSPMIDERFHMSKAPKSTDLFQQIPKHSAGEIMQFYTEVSERVRQMLQGKEAFYANNVNRQHLVKSEDEEEAGSPEPQESGTAAPEQQQSFEEMKKFLQEMVNRNEGQAKKRD